MMLHLPVTTRPVPSMLIFFCVIQYISCAQFWSHFSDADEKFNDRDISSPPPSLTRRKSVFDRLKHFIAIGSESIEDTESDGRG